MDKAGKEQVLGEIKEQFANVASVVIADYRGITVPVVTVPTPDLPMTPVAAPPNSSLENTPEPVSIALWSAMAGAGFLRARAFRRARRAAAFA